jgi:hypothetical protein
MLSIARAQLGPPLWLPPRFDPTHIASLNCQFSGVSCGTGFVNLLKGGGSSSLSGSPTNSISGVIGCTTYYSGSSDASNFTNFNSNNVASMTGAAIFLRTSNPSNNAYFIGASGLQGFLSGGTNTLGVELNNSGPYFSTFTTSLNVPYFVVASATTGSVINFLALNLLSGQIQTQSITAETVAVESSGLGYVGNKTGGARPATAYVAATMMGGVYLSPTDLLAWAQDPWSFWYPSIDVDDFIVGTSSPLFNYANPIIITTREQPINPIPVITAGVFTQPTVLFNPTRQSIITTQEQTVLHPFAMVATRSVQGPNVGTPERRGLVTLQEVPFHPLPATSIGIQGPNVGGPERRSFVTTQEIPVHPGPSLRTGLPTVVTAERRTAIVTQEVPLLHPGAFLRSGAPPVSVFGPPTTQVLIRGQEQPGHPLPATLRSIQGPNVGGPERRAVVVPQEVPLLHPLPSISRWNGVQGPNVGGPEKRTAIVAQEVPFHPLPVTGRSVQGSNVSGPERRTLLTLQEAPDHPRPATFAGVTPVSVFPLTRPMMVREQERPFHPLPSTVVGLFSTTITAERRAIVVAQESVTQPGSVARAGVYLNPLVLPYVSVGSIRVLQELPLGHPSPIVLGSFVPFTFPVYQSLTQVTGAFGVTTVR